MIKDIYNYVNNYLNIDISSRSRKREYAEGRALFYYLCRENTNLTLREIGEYVNKDHCAVLNALSNTFPTITNKAIKRAINDFNQIDLTSDDLELIEVLRINNLLKIENRQLKERIEVNQIKDNKIQSKLNELTTKQYARVTERIEIMLSMVVKEVEPIEAEEMEEAEI
jgi:regulator of replication initiation timing